MTIGKIESADRTKIILAVLVAGLGYLVDAYDLIIFSAVRVASLQGIGLGPDEITNAGVFLLDIQMAGMLLGGVLWGIWGDKRGRLEVLFGSILLYSLANIANAFVTDVSQYAWCRFIGGIGLAGEIGAGITLVSELMPKEKRGYGTMVVAAMGLLGSLIAGLVGDVLHWKTAYILGGVMGFALLILRISVAESGMYKAARRNETVRHGDLRLLFGSWHRMGRFVGCVLVGVPLWLVIGLLLTFAPEIARATGIVEPVKVATAMVWISVTFAVGNLVMGAASQYFGTRKKVILACMVCLFITSFALLNGAAPTATAYYAVLAVAGLFLGYWAPYLGATAEQFGTNLRATVTTSVPNLVRGSIILLTTAFVALKEPVGVVGSLEMILIAVNVLALVSWWFMRETYGIDLNFVETDKGAEDLAQIHARLAGLNAEIMAVDGAETGNSQKVQGSRT